MAKETNLKNNSISEVKKMKRKIICCKRCKTQIDKSDAQERFTIITRRGVENEKYQERFYLCDCCTLSLDVWILKGGALQ